MYNRDYKKAGVVPYLFWWLVLIGTVIGTALFLHSHPEHVVLVSAVILCGFFLFHILMNQEEDYDDYDDED